MFGFGKKKRSNTVESLTNQCIGGQSVLYRYFVEALKVHQNEIRKIELTYFSLAALTYVFLRMAKLENKENIIDESCMAVFEKSLPNCGEALRKDQLISEYQNRYKEYDALLRHFFKKPGEVNSEACTSLLMHFYEKTMDKSAKDSMIQILMATPLIEQYILDNIDFIKTKF